MSASKGKGERLPKGANGVKRDVEGRFLPGTKGGPGNPQAAHTSRLRAALLNAVTEKDVAEVARVLVQEAKDGDVPACTLLLNRLLGRSLDGPDILERLEKLEQELEV